MNEATAGPGPQARAPQRPATMTRWVTTTVLVGVGALGRCAVLSVIVGLAYLGTAGTSGQEGEVPFERVGSLGLLALLTGLALVTTGSLLPLRSRWVVRSLVVAAAAEVVLCAVTAWQVVVVLDGLDDLSSAAEVVTILGALLALLPLGVLADPAMM